MNISPNRLERYYERYEFTTRHMLSSSDCESQSIAELLELEPDAHQQLLQLWCGYTEPKGGLELRTAIADLYEKRTCPHDVLVCSSAQEGLFLFYHAVLLPGDHVIVETPCYEPGLELARSAGADVSPWPRRWERGWAHDLDELRELVR